MAKEADYKPFKGGVNRIFAGDKVMWIVIIILLVYSLFVVYSTTAYDDATNANQELIRQILFICIGMTGFYVAQITPIRWYRRLNVPFFLLAMSLTLVMIATHDKEGAARGLQIVRGLYIQPFEMLKFATVINLAAQLSIRQKKMDKLRIMPSFRAEDWRERKSEQVEILTTQTIPLLLPIAICCATTVKFSNSTTLIIATSCLAMMYLSRINKRDLAKIVLVGVLIGGCVVGAYGVKNGRLGTLQGRVSSWVPDVVTKSVKVGEQDGKEYYLRHKNKEGRDKEHDQTVYAKMSVASGGILGKGPGHSTNRYLAEADKDMAYAFLIEEYGLIGGLIMLFAYLLMFYRSLEIFHKCGTAFPGLLVLGIGTVIVLQAFLHMLVSVSLFPLTGQQLPIVSKGGTSLVITLTMLGVLMGVSARAEEEEAERQRRRAERAAEQK